jgi:hypothetical protein
MNMLLPVLLLLAASCTVPVCVVCWLFIFKDTEPSPFQDSSSVRQQGGFTRTPPP